ncbi:hypothetical protein Tcan_04788 [Toxocara canis]|uniref:Uncharacterized protein n=1 Tax=Toxocara canis TaxID=6265 RepID=A0A0B2W4W8_TOXCA|nr:hypothetical protein Tcan_04788 [Toxocara canis]
MAAQLNGWLSSASLLRGDNDRDRKCRKRNMKAEVTASSTTIPKVLRRRQKLAGRGEMFIAIIQMALASAIINTGLFMAYTFMRTVQEWVKEHAQSDKSQYLIAMRNIRLTYCFALLSLGGCVFLTKFAVLLRIFFAKVSVWRTITADVTISILTASFAFLCGMHASDVLNYPNDMYASVNIFVNAIEQTTLELRERALPLMSELHQKLLCCGVHGPVEMMQTSPEATKFASHRHWMQIDYENITHNCKLPESCCVHMRPGCNIKRKDVKAQPTFFKDGCSQRLAQILGEHLLLLSLNSAALTILSIFNVFYVCTHRKTQSTKEEEVEPTVVIPPPVEVVDEQTPQSINPTISH